MHESRVVGDESGSAASPLIKRLKNSRAGWLWAIGAAVGVYFLLALGTALTLRPWIDEAWGAAPAWSLAARGYLGTPSFRAEAWGMTGMEHHTYWFMPGFLLIQAAFYKIFGFSLIRLRLMCILFGAAGLVSWIYFLWALTRDRATTLLFVALICCDYVLMTTAATGRPDITAFAFQAGGLALYMYFREARLETAVLTSQACIMLAGMNHPNGGMLGLGALCFLTFYLDRRRIRLRHYAIAAIPYAAGAVCWGAYILRDPAAFLSQYGFQTSMRFFGAWQPLVSLKREFLLRYVPNMGLGGHYEGSKGPHWLKSYYFIAYAAGLIGTLASSRLRRTQAARILLAIAAMFFCFMWLLEATKASYYFIYIIFPYTAILALWLRHLWFQPRVRPLVIAGAALFVVLQAGGDAYRIKLNSWGHYKPMVAYLRQHAGPNDTIIGSHELGFSIGFTPRFLDDYELGLKTGERPDFLVFDEIYDDRMEMVHQKRPQEYQQLQHILAGYRVVFQNGSYRVLERSDRLTPERRPG
jgi:4-amino-4-deoxy-L-arabinose transferase-like glycosyltransferase